MDDEFQQRPAQADELGQKCLLVSDSNEIQTQMDSKRLPYDTLVGLAQTNLFNSYVDLSSYITVNQFQIYAQRLKKRISDVEARIPSGAPNPKLRVVDGQVILLHAADVPSGTSPQDYIRAQWDVTPEFQLQQISNCMLRGVLCRTNNETGSDVVVEHPENGSIALS